MMREHAFSKWVASTIDTDHLHPPATRSDRAWAAQRLLESASKLEARALRPCASYRGKFEPAAARPVEDCASPTTHLTKQLHHVQVDGFPHGVAGLLVAPDRIAAKSCVPQWRPRAWRRLRLGLPLLQMKATARIQNTVSLETQLTAASLAQEVPPSLCSPSLCQAWQNPHGVMSGRAEELTWWTP